MTNILFKRHLPLTILIIVLICLLLLLSNSTFDNSIKYVISRSSDGTFHPIVKNFRFSKIEKPVCEGNLLDQKNHEKGLADFKTLTANFRSCQLIQFNFESLVNCLDDLYLKNYLAGSYFNGQKQQTLSSPKLNFLFIGDSRIRQQFFNFLKINLLLVKYINDLKFLKVLIINVSNSVTCKRDIRALEIERNDGGAIVSASAYASVALYGFIPDYDRQTYPTPILPSHHGDIEVITAILNLRISFKWHSLVNHEVKKMLSELEKSTEAERPFMIFLSIAVWHMLHSFGSDFQNYQEKLIQISPVLSQLSNFSNIIWLNQYPTVEIYGKSDAHNTDIFSEKIFNYNNAALQVFRKQGEKIRIWDSSNILVEEYIRSCLLFQRANFEPSKFLYPANFYINCQDYVHAGYSALSQATQILYNDICNFKDV